MFVNPKQVKAVKSAGAFASSKVNAASIGGQKINPATVLGSVGKISKLLPIEKDSFLSSLVGGFNSTLANPILSTTGRDKLATVDPYKGVINTPQNQLSSILSNYFGTAGTIVGGIMKNEPLRKMTSEFIRTGKVDSETSKAYLKGFQNNLLAGVSEGAAPWLNQVQKNIGITGIDGKQLLSSALGVDGAPRIEDVLKQNPTINMIIKGKEYFANADFSSTNGIFKVIENLTGNKALSSLLDLKTELALMNVITKSLMVFDAPDLFSKVGEWFRTDVLNPPSGNATSYDAETEYYLDNLQNAIDESSITYMEGLLTRVGASKVLDRNRNFVQDFLANYLLRYDQEPSAALGIRLNNVMTQIDPNWAKAQLINGKGDYVSDLKPFKLMSNDACRLFMLANLYVTELTIADYYQIKPMTEYMKSLYPLANLS